MRKALLAVIILAIVTVGTVHAAEWIEAQRVSSWKVYNPYFDNTDRWFTRLGE